MEKELIIVILEDAVDAAMMVFLSSENYDHQSFLICGVSAILVEVRNPVACT